MELHTKYNTRIFLGVVISLIIIVATLIVSSTVSQYLAGFFLLAVFVYLTVQKMLYKLLVEEDSLILEYKIFIFIKKQEKYTLSDIKFKFEKEARFRRGVFKKLVIIDKTGHVIDEIEKNYFANPSDLNKLVGTKK